MTAFIIVIFVLIAGGIIFLIATHQPRGVNAAALEVSPAIGTCLGCQGPLSALGREAFRVGGTSGGWKLLFGEWAELGEDKVPLDVFACQRCRRVELRVPAA